MTGLYFVRHAQPDYRTGTDRTFSLSEEGMSDRLKALEALKGIRIDAAFSSPYRRSLLTIEPILNQRNLTVTTDERLRERVKGQGQCNTSEMFIKRWADHNFCEPGGESLAQTQKRNIEAVSEILDTYRDKNILIGTHGTALCTIINFYDGNFGYEDFMRAIDFMPWVIRLDFEGCEYKGREEIAFIEKEFHGCL